MRFVSHLDMTRFMQRATARAELPLWRTEGFNPRPYITFALPLSLGFESSYEIMEFRLTDDGFDISSLPALLNAVCPEYIRFFDAAEPIKKMKSVSFADFAVTLDDGGKFADALREFLKRGEILCEKKTKRGEIKQLDLAPQIDCAEVSEENGNTLLKLRLPAGPVNNINPELLLGAFFNFQNEKCGCSILRTAILDEDKQLFR